MYCGPAGCKASDLGSSHFPARFNPNLGRVYDYLRQVGGRLTMTDPANFRRSVKNCALTPLGYELFEGRDDFVPPRQQRFDLPLL